MKSVILTAFLVFVSPLTTPRACAQNQPDTTQGALSAWTLCAGPVMGGMSSQKTGVDFDMSAELSFSTQTVFWWIDRGLIMGYDFSVYRPITGYDVSLQHGVIWVGPAYVTTFQNSETWLTIHANLNYSSWTFDPKAGINVEGGIGYGAGILIMAPPLGFGLRINRLNARLSGLGISADVYSDTIWISAGFCSKPKRPH